MATIRERNNRWQCIVKRKGYPLQSKTFNLKKDAERWAREQESNLDAGTWVDRTEAAKTNLGELLQRYISEVSRTKRGAEVEVIRLQALMRTHLAKYSVLACTGTVLAQWRDQRLTSVQGSTVAREFRLLSHVFTVAIREWGFGLQCNPCTLVQKPRCNPARNRVLTDAERTSLLNSCSECKNPWIHPIVIFALETGARRGEILSLTWADIDLVRGTARVQGKTGARCIPLTCACTEMLKQVQQALPRRIDGRVFACTVQALKQAYNRAVQRAGIPDFTFHDLRHDALTRLAKLGLNVLELRAISGHTTANMLQRYVSIDARELSCKLDKLLRVSA